MAISYLESREKVNQDASSKSYSCSNKYNCLIFYEIKYRNILIYKLLYIYNISLISIEKNKING